MATEVHFIATLEVKRIERDVPDERVRTSSTHPIPPREQTEPRSIQTVANLTLRADELESLTKKLNAHIALIDED